MSYIEDIQNKRNEVRNNIARGFGCEFVKAQDDELEGVIEKAVYADTPQNRKLGRVGQEYHRGKGKNEDWRGLKGKTTKAEKEYQKKQKNIDKIPDEFKNRKNLEYIDFSEYNPHSPYSYATIKMGKKAFELFPKGKQFKDEKGNVWTVDKHDKNMEDSRGEGFGFIRLRNEKKRAKKITPRKFLDGIAPHGFTTGIKELDDFARKHLKTYSYEERKYK